MVNAGFVWRGLSFKHPLIFYIEPRSFKTCFTWFVKISYPIFHHEVYLSLLCWIHICLTQVSNQWVIVFIIALATFTSQKGSWGNHGGHISGEINRDLEGTQTHYCCRLSCGLATVLLWLHFRDQYRTSWWLCLVQISRFMCQVLCGLPVCYPKSGGQAVNTLATALLRLHFHD